MMVVLWPLICSMLLTIWPKRPMPTTRIGWCSSMVSASGVSAGFAPKRRCRMRMSGVMAIDSTMMAVMLALTVASMTPALAAAA